MAADVIQTNYEELEAIATRFKYCAEENAELYSQMVQRVQALQEDWEGKGSAAFLTEMKDEVFPAMRRLTSALEQAGSVTLEIKEIIRQAEEEAARVFQGNGNSGNGNTVGKGLEPGAVDQIDIKPPPPLPPDNPSQPYVVQPADTVFHEKYFNQIVGLKVPVRDSAVLNETMEHLLENPAPAERDRLLALIADQRGRPLAELRQEYDKFLNIREAARRKPTKLDTTNEWFDINDNPDFLGSTVSLRYGKVVGDVFGVDPVFGALLNPTGGLMGPDNGLPFQPGENTPLSYHSVFHDAAGYLKSYHDLGPGYNYLDKKEEGRDTRDPLTGQRSGIRYWHNRMDSPGPDWIVEPAIERVMSGAIHVIEFF